MKFFAKKKEELPAGIPTPPAVDIPKRLEDFALSPSAREEILKRRAERMKLADEIWDALRGAGGRKGHWEL